MTPEPASVLLVDDDVNYPFLMRQAFAKEGWGEVLRVVGEVPAARLYLEDATHPPPRLVLCDLKLPGSSGLDLLRWIRGHDGLRWLPVIMHSYACSDEDLDELRRSGANAYVQKPMSFDSLRRLVRCLVRFWLVENLVVQAL